MALCVVAGLLLPRMSAVLIEVVPGMITTVICTGDALIVVTLGPDGQPVELPEEIDTHCVMADGATSLANVAPDYRRLERHYSFGFKSKTHDTAGLDRLARQAPSRAPPVKA